MVSESNTLMTMTTPRAKTVEYLQRYLDKYPEELAGAVMEIFDAGGVRWKPTLEGDAPDTGVGWDGLSYMRPGKIRRLWEQRWPDGNPAPHWDLVGRIQTGQAGCWEWLCISAASSVEELHGDCPAGTYEDIQAIGEILEDAKHRAQTPPAADWLHGYYGHASTLALRAFLTSQSSCGRVLFVYFMDDSDAHDAPTREEWETTIGRLESHLGITGKSVLERRVFKLFLPIPG